MERISGARSYKALAVQAFTKSLANKVEGRKAEADSREWRMRIIMLMALVTSLMLNLWILLYTHTVVKPSGLDPMLLCPTAPGMRKSVRGPTR